MSNTESDVFRWARPGRSTILVAGRWFTAPDFTGPWTFATLKLPADFKKIPLEHDRSRVLASVPGTDQAAEAVLLAQLPQTARVDKNSLKAPDVKYQGDAEIQADRRDDAQRAVNTDKDIIKVGDLYYMCFQGVWFMSKAATGPWEVTGRSRKQIYKIPVSSPSHNVTYVTVEESSRRLGRVCVRGRLHGSDGRRGAAPSGARATTIRPTCTTAARIRSTIRSSRPTGTRPGTTRGPAPTAAAPWRTVPTGEGVAARYNPYTGTYARGAVAWGPYGARGAAQAYNPRTGTYAQTRQGSSVYGSWGSTYVQRGDDWAQTSRVTNRVTGNTTRVTRT